MVELRRPIKVMLFISSYFPLFGILAIETWPIQAQIFGYTVPWMSAIFITLIIIPLPLPFLVAGVRSNSGDDSKRVDQYRRRNDMVTSYLLVYVFGYLGLEYTQITSWLAFLIFFGVVAIIQLRSEQLHVNPLLALFGYDIYEVTFGREVRLVITGASLEERLIPPDDENGDPDYASDERYLQVAELGNDVYITV